ncbi:hypothetical protein AYI68_g2442 [Smittium mucronatum]|uniref:Uncharacterized protein n=1 Tax=Smittium mucronatum TaxID=133383 RepID=A0A1R0H2T1_9FUNG|nr:hypothetical protein AYI68_g2442 [Smittium mucronatum]
MDYRNGYQSVDDDDDYLEKYDAKSEASYFAPDDMSYMEYEEENEDDGTNELVRAIVSNVDDTSLPVLTFSERNFHDEISSAYFYCFGCRTAGIPYGCIYGRHITN